MIEVDGFQNRTGSRKGSRYASDHLKKNKVVGLKSIIHGYCDTDEHFVKALFSVCEPSLEGFRNRFGDIREMVLIAHKETKMPPNV